MALPETKSIFLLKIRSNSFLKSKKYRYNQAKASAQNKQQNQYHSFY